MRLMERIRRHGATGLKVFLIFFLVSVFAGLGIGFMSPGGFGGSRQQAQPQGEFSGTLTPEKAEIALVVNGREVEQHLLAERVRQIVNMYGAATQDPQMMLVAIGSAAQNLIGEEALLAEAAKRGLRVKDADLREKREEVVEQFGGTAAKPEVSGNMLGDMGIKVRAARERRSEFNRYLERSGMTIEEWEAIATREIMQDKLREAITEEVKSKNEEEANATKALIDEELAKGKSFAELVKEHGDNQQAADGGDLKDWLGYEFLGEDDERNAKLFATPKGQLTEWFTIDAGFQRFEVYDKQEASGPEFEAEKPKLIEEIRTAKNDPKYEPTDDEIAKKYMKVKVRQIELHTSDPEAVQEQINELQDKAEVQINNAYVLAYQAMYMEKLQPMSGQGYEQLEALARRAAIGEGYNFGLIRGKLERGQQQAEEKLAPQEEAAAKAAESVGTSAEGSAESGAAEGAQPTAETPAAEGTEEAAAANQEAAPADSAAATPASATPAETEDLGEDNPGGPVYALAIGLLELALERQGSSTGPFGQAIIAQLYMDWLKNAATLKGQPLDEAKAREEVEKYLARAVEQDNYNALLHASRGLNLAWLGKEAEAKTSLETAENYAPGTQEGGALQVIKDAYDKLGMTDKAAEIQARMDKARQEALQRQIEQSMAQQSQAQTIDLGQMQAPEALGGIEVDGGAGEGSQ